MPTEAERIKDLEDDVKVLTGMVRAHAALLSGILNALALEPAMHRDSIVSFLADVRTSYSGVYNGPEVDIAMSEFIDILGQGQDTLDTPLSFAGRLQRLLLPRSYAGAAQRLHANGAVVAKP